MTTASHEIVLAFRAEGLELHPTLVEMLEEAPEHRTERRGCGYTQATRFLSAHVNKPRLPTSTDDLSLFAWWPVAPVELLAHDLVRHGWSRGWRALDRMPEELQAMARVREGGEALLELGPRLRRIRARLRLPESLLLHGLIEQVLAGSGRADVEFAGMAVKPEIGSCSQAEEYFLEIAHGRVRRHGAVNCIVDASGRVLMVEKIGLGESHSALVLEPVLVNGVALPPGSLCALRHAEPMPGCAGTVHGRAIPVDAVEVRFLRLTTLCVPPEDRRRAFSAQLAAQLHAGMLSPATTTLDDLRSFARGQVAQAR